MLSFRDEENAMKSLIKIIIGILVLLVLGVIASKCFFSINTGERWLLTRFGKAQSGVINEWLHFKIPFADGVVKYNTKVIKIASTLSSSSKDQQVVSTTFSLNYSLKLNDIRRMYSDYGTIKNLEDNVLSPAIQEVVKTATAKFNAEELVTKREEMINTSKKLIIEKMKNLPINIVAINVENFKFSKSFNDAIEAKVTAVQNALKAENDLKRIEFESKQSVIKAKAEAEALTVSAKAKAEAIKIQANAIKENGGDSYLRLKHIEKWNWEMPTHILGKDASVILNG